LEAYKKHIMDIQQFFNNVARLSIKMRIYRAIQSANSDTGDLRDREVLILELLNTQGPMSMTDLLRFFPGIKQSTLSTDVKRLRSELDLVDMTVDKNDMRIHRIELSAGGRDKVAEIKQQRAQSYAPLATAIGDVPEEIDVINRIVENTIEMVDQKINEHAETSN